MYVSSTDVSSVMWCPLDSVTTCCFVHFKIGPSYFLNGLPVTVCPWVLINFATFGPKLHLLSPRGKESFGKYWQFWTPGLLISKQALYHCAVLTWCSRFFFWLICACGASATCVWPAYGLRPSHFNCLCREGSQVTPMDDTMAGPRIGMDEPYVSEVDKLFVHQWTFRA